jgi:hypothetical protein
MGGVMARSRKTEDVAPTTILRWLKVYMVELHKMVEDGRIYEEEGKKAAKGLRYSITALEDSKKKWMKERATNAEEAYKQADAALR